MVTTGFESTMDSFYMPVRFEGLAEDEMKTQWASSCANSFHNRTNENQRFATLRGNLILLYMFKLTYEETNPAFVSTPSSREVPSRALFSPKIVRNAAPKRVAPRWISSCKHL
jgi:hypothetical protein